MSHLFCSRDKAKYDEIFKGLEQHHGKITGRTAKQELLKSKLSSHVLGKVWRLADHDEDGMLNDEEFALAMHLIKVKCDGHNLPETLPSHLIPPGQSKDRQAENGVKNGVKNGVNGSEQSE